MKHGTRTLLYLALAALFPACNGKDPASLCNRFYTPYPDLVSSQARIGTRNDLLDAIAFYNDGKFTEALPGLQQVIQRDPGNSLVRMYLASACLGAGDPYKAEMHLDFLENQADPSFKDQVDWYNALCWLCEGDTARAATQARYITGRPHTYRKEAQALIDALKP
jgi:predicted Zn-dependent protease